MPIRHLATAAVLVAFWFTLALAQAAPSDEEAAMASLQSLAARCQAGLVRRVSVHPDSDKYWRRTIYQPGAVTHEIRETELLASPYLGLIEFPVSEVSQSAATEAAPNALPESTSERDAQIVAKSTWRLQYVWQDGRWIYRRLRWAYSLPSAGFKDRPFDGATDKNLLSAHPGAAACFP